MTSVTAVPLRPIQKGSMRRLWLAMLFIVLAAALLTWLGLHAFGRGPSHEKDGRAGRIVYQIIDPGKGGHPTKDDYVQISYKGSLTDGTVFEQTPQPTAVPLASMIPGFTDAVTQLGKGGHIRAWIPPTLAYGSESKGDVIPANSTLIFDLTLHEFKSPAEIQELQREAQMQQMLQQQMQQQGGGAPGGQPGAAPAPGPEGAPQ